MAFFGMKKTSSVDKSKPDQANANKKRLDFEDSLTGAKTYKAFVEVGKELFSNNPKLPFSMLQINIRNFKYINDVYGGQQGDEILCRLVKQLAETLEDNEIFARLKDDNFLILLAKPDFAAGLRYFNELNKSLKSSVGTGAICELYAGIYFTPKEGIRPEFSIMISNAQLALRAASKNKKQYVVFDDKMRIDIEKEAAIIRSMNAALDSDEFTFYLQPRHNITDCDKVRSAEALVRWIRQDGSVVFPSDFIPVFERNGFIVDLDRYLFRKVCSFVTGIDDTVSISVNVSNTGLYRNDFVDFYIRTKKETNVPDGRIELEFNESSMFEDFDNFKDMILRLKAAGFRCALDDFGSGSSSLNVLKELPVDLLKMDRKFFSNADVDKKSSAVISSVISMAHGMGMEVVAQGVEDMPQVEFLRRIGCDAVQGYVFSKPLVTTDFLKYAREFVGGGYSDSDDIQKADISAEERIRAVLDSMSALVAEIDLNSSKFTILSDSRGAYYVPEKSGAWKDFVINYIKNSVFPEYQKNYVKFLSTQNLNEFFSSGNEKISFEYQSKHHTGATGFTEEKEWHRATIRKVSTKSTDLHYVLLKIKNINSNYEAELEKKKALSVVESIMKGIRGTVYDVSVSGDKISLVENSSGFAAPIGNGKFVEKLKQYIDSSLDENNAANFKKILSKAFLKEILFGEDIKEYSFNYVECRRDGTTRERAAQFIRKEENGVPGLTLILRILE